MASRPGTVTHLPDVLSGAGAVTVRQMFGEHAVCLDGKVMGLSCDDQLFLKPVPVGSCRISRTAQFWLTPCPTLAAMGNGPARCIQVKPW